MYYDHCYDCTRRATCWEEGNVGVCAIHCECAPASVPAPAPTPPRPLPRTTPRRYKARRRRLIPASGPWAGPSAEDMAEWDSIREDLRRPRCERCCDPILIDHTHCDDCANPQEASHA